MKFDVVIMNPPYQKGSKEFKKTTPIWHRFVFKALEVLKEDGFLCAVHPSGWRKTKGIFKKVKDLLLSKQLLYLEMHDIKDGQKTFGASTRYDWYVLKNNANNNCITNVKDQNGCIENVDLTEMDFIPNGMFAEIAKLVAKDD